LRVEKKVEFLSFFLRHVMRNLDPDLRAIHAYEKVQEVTQVRPILASDFQPIVALMIP
jgi:hypothetical protein